ncbi:hypothetical protein [Stenotrophomonas sp. P5_B8]
MRSDNNELDIFKHDPRLQGPALRKLAKAYRAAAETALRDVQFTDSERKSRNDYYLAEAKRLEAEARKCQRPPRRRRNRSIGAPSP